MVLWHIVPQTKIVHLWLIMPLWHPVVLVQHLLLWVVLLQAHWGLQ